MLYAANSFSTLTSFTQSTNSSAAASSSCALGKKFMSIMTIGYDKINQLRHVRYFKNAEGLKAHMQKHAAILRPKFEAVLGILDKELAGSSDTYFSTRSISGPAGVIGIVIISMPKSSVIAKCLS